MARRLRLSDRRRFIQQTAVAGMGFWVAAGTTRGESRSANEKLNVAVIGCGGKGASDTDGCAGENIVALCDVDEQRAGKTFEKYPQAARYKDFRKMLEQRKDIDAVVVSTPDHTHAAASIMAMKLGKHVYCQKPLTRTVYEARRMREVAAESKVATQMGNQGTAEAGLRRAVELVQGGVIGPVREVHVWTNRPIWPQGIPSPLAAQVVPKHLDWDLWLGPAPRRPYNEGYVPFKWRGWWDFGTGALGDMACHTANMAFMALKLGAPSRIKATALDPVSPESPPRASTIEFDFPARDRMPPVKFTWYDGKYEKTVDDQRVEVKNLPSEKLVRNLTLTDSGSLLIGEQGVLFSPNDYGAAFKLIYDNDIQSITSPEKSLPASPGHYKEWIQACKGGPPAMSNFEYAARLTEAILLGNVALRVGKAIHWDADRLTCKDCPEAQQYIQPEYRQGWSI